MHFLSSILCVWDTISLNCDVISLSETGPRTPMWFWEPLTSDTPGTFLLTYDTCPMYFVYLSHNLRFHGVNRSPEVSWCFVDPPPPPPITTTTTTTTTKVHYILWIRITVFLFMMLLFKIPNSSMSAMLQVIMWHQTDGKQLSEYHFTGAHVHPSA